MIDWFFRSFLAAAVRLQVLLTMLEDGEITSFDWDGNIITPLFLDCPCFSSFLTLTSTKLLNAVAERGREDSRNVLKLLMFFMQGSGWMRYFCFRSFEFSASRLVLCFCWLMMRIFPLFLPTDLLFLGAGLHFTQWRVNGVAGHLMLVLGDV